MDIVIPFVDCSEKIWVRNYLSLNEALEQSQPINFTYFQYYNYNTIKYVFRGIDRYMPYVENVFLIVSNIEQVPEYVDQTKVKVILHKDFIPEKYLPTFQANTIEMFMYNIPGLGEKFVYFNDDMIPISSIPYDELFKDGLPCINFVENYTNKNIPTHKIFNNSFNEAHNTVNMFMGGSVNYSSTPLCPVHGPTPLLKSICIEAASTQRHQQLIDFYTTTFRRPKNLNQYYWADILFFMNKYVPSNLNVKLIQTRYIDDFNIEDIKNGFGYLCINDFGTDKYPLSKIESIIKEKLDTILGDKCKYERDL